MIDEILFRQNHIPGLNAGDYEITVEQEVKHSKITSQTPFTTTRRFSVRGDRFALRPTDTQAVFPPPGCLGNHSNVLLRRSTLPWERRADQNSDDAPWLALLLFYEGEAPKPEIVSLQEIGGSRAKFPTLDLEGGQSGADKVTVIDVEKKLLQGILP